MDILAFKIEPHRYPADIDRLVAVAAARDCTLPRSDAAMVWDDYSESCAAGWMTMAGRTDDELWSIIEARCERMSLEY